jgi:flagellar biosynthetic protein FlhB
MSEQSDQERTEPASPRRLEQAREEGNVPQSKELLTFVLLTLGALILWAIGTALARALSQFVAFGLTFTRYDYADTGSVWLQLGTALLPVVGLLAVLLGALFIGGFSPMALTRGAVSAKPLTPDLSRILKLQGLKRMFSIQGWIELPRLLLKLALVVTVTWLTLRYYELEFLGLARQSMGDALNSLFHMLGVCFILMTAVLALVAAVDIPFVLWQHYKKLRMTRDEVRRESKESDGSPEVKARIRSLQRQAAQRRMMTDLPTADVIVTNPTHYAVALRYAEGGMSAPKVIAKGADLIAARIREVGTEHRIPMLEAPPLARALYRHTEIGESIPEALYAAVAEVLAYVYQMRRVMAQGGAIPPPPQDLPVPADLDPDAGMTVDRGRGFA